MCGRTRCTLRAEDVPRASYRHNRPARFLHVDRYRPSYNVAPGSYMPVLRRDNDGVAVHCMQWGLVPSFTNKTDKPDFFKMFNARSESVAEKASFRRLLPKNRCLVVVDGFYEWKKEGSKKQPYYIHFKDGRPLVFAALFDSWQNAGGETLYTFTILTTTSSSALQWLHDRMPVILGDKDSVDKWLDDPSTLKLKPLLAPYENSDLVWYPVTSAIGKPTFDGPECIQQIPLKTSQNCLISKFFSAKQPKTDGLDKETKPQDANIAADLKQEPMVEGYEEVVSSGNIVKDEELDEVKDIQNEAKNLENVKTEFVDNSAVVSHLESVKNEPEECTDGEGKCVKAGLTEETGESNASVLPESNNPDLLIDSKEEPEMQGHCTNEELNQLEPHEAVQGESENENQKTTLACQTTKESGLELNEKSSGKSGTKRDFEVFSSQEKPVKQFKRVQDVKSFGKSGGKQGKGKSKAKETQSTLHFFFDEK